MIEDDSSDKIIKLKKSIAHEMGVTFEHLEKIVSPYEAIYTIADHKEHYYSLFQTDHYLLM